MDWILGLEEGTESVRDTLTAYVGSAGDEMSGAPEADVACAAAAIVAAALDASLDELAERAMFAVKAVSDAEPEEIVEYKRLAAEAVPLIARSDRAGTWEGDREWWSMLGRIGAAVDAEVPGAPTGRTPPEPEPQPEPEGGHGLDEAVRRARLEVVAAAGAGMRPEFERAAAVYVHTLVRRASAENPAMSAPPLDAFVDEFVGSGVPEQLWQAAQGNAAATLLTMLSMLEQQF